MEDEACKAALHCHPPGTIISLSINKLPHTMPIPDSINHPPHYQGKKFECIDIIEDYDLGFCLGNALKYILRAGKKDDRDEDIRKAIWYLQREIASV